MKNLITKINDASVYFDAFEEKYEDYSISFDWGDIDETFAELAGNEQVNVADCVSEQEEIENARFQELIGSGNYNGAYGVRFAGNSEVLVCDGNHRICAAINDGVQTITMRIINI